MHTPRMHKKFLFRQSFVRFFILFDMMAVSLLALAQKGFFYF